MAYFNITTNKKGVLTAKIQAYGVDLDTMKRKVRYKRITNDDGLSRAKFTKLVEREANAFEDSLNELYQKALNGERMEILSFPKLAEEWLQRTKTTLSINYYVRSSKIVEKFNEYLKDSFLYDQPINKITVRHIQLYLDTFGRKPQRGLVKLKKDLPEKVNFRELARQKILTSNSAYRMKKLNANIQTKTAEKICEFYDLNFKEYFEVIETEQFYASETIKGVRRVLRTIFNEAIRYDWITKNPVCMTKIGVGNSNISIREVAEKEVYSITESQEFIKALDRMPDELIYKKVPLKFLILTGVRISELQGLRWSDIDFEHKVVHVQRNRIYSSSVGTYEKDPKTKTSKRIIPLPQDLIDDLIKFKDWFREADDKFDEHLDSTYIVSNVYRQPAGIGVVRQWLDKFEKDNGFKHVCCHGLRHTYCSVLLTQSVPIQTVTKYLGHSESTVTLEVYSHFMPDTQERALNALDVITGKK